MEQNALIGRTIVDMKIADDRKALLFIRDDGETIVRVDGDCCSQTWIEHIELPALGFPAKVLSVEDKVLSVEDIDMPDLGPMEDCDIIAYYGCKITTDKGDILIDYRNESNGYYGGNLAWPEDDYFYGGVYGQNISTQNWIEIKE